MKLELKKLIKYSKKYYANGWMPATAGNLSVFNRKKNIMYISASGKNKGKLKTEDFILMNPFTDEILEDTKNHPSAETSIHQAIYKNIHSANACIHVHTIASCKLIFGMQRNDFAKRFYLPNLEILKAFGNFKENPNLAYIVTYNHATVLKIADDFQQSVLKQESDVPFFLIEKHGLTVWGKDVEEANKNLEAIDFILNTMI